MTNEEPRDGSVLDAAQRQRILGAVIEGPIVELLRRAVRKLPVRPDAADKQAEYALKTERGLQPMRLDIPASVESPRSGIGWPGTQLTWDDRRRLCTVGHLAQLPMTHVLHHAVVFTHHVFRTLILEVTATHERTGTPVRDLLAAIVDTVEHEPQLYDGRPPELPLNPVRHDSTHGAAGLSPVTTSFDATPAAAAITASLAGEADPTRPFPNPLPPPTMPRPSAEPKPNRAPSSDQIERLEQKIDNLEHEMALLRDSIDVLRVALDEAREDLVHALRNRGEPPPPPLHIHSLALDPTAEDYGERINAVPADVMAKLRAEAGSGGGEPSFAAAAEGRPNEPSHLDGGNGRTHAPGRQKKLFG